MESKGVARVRAVGEGTRRCVCGGGPGFPEAPRGPWDPPRSLKPRLVILVDIYKKELSILFSDQTPTGNKWPPCHMILVVMLLRVEETL